MDLDLDRTGPGSVRFDTDVEHTATDVQITQFKF
jgi:hypothetical protein